MSLDGGYRLEDAQKVCFKNDLVRQDIDKLSGVIRNIYFDMGADNGNYANLGELSYLQFRIFVCKFYM